MGAKGRIYFFVCCAVLVLSTKAASQVMPPIIKPFPTDLSKPVLDTIADLKAQKKAAETASAAAKAKEADVPDITSVAADLKSGLQVTAPIYLDIRKDSIRRETTIADKLNNIQDENLAVAQSLKDSENIFDKIAVLLTSQGDSATRATNVAKARQDLAPVVLALGKERDAIADAQREIHQDSILLGAEITKIQGMLPGIQRDSGLLRKINTKVAKDSSFMVYFASIVTSEDSIANRLDSVIKAKQATADILAIEPNEPHFGFTVVQLKRFYGSALNGVLNDVSYSTGSSQGLGTLTPEVYSHIIKVESSSLSGRFSLGASFTEQNSKTTISDTLGFIDKFLSSGGDLTARLSIPFLYSPSGYGSDDYTFYVFLFEPKLNTNIIDAGVDPATLKIGLNSWELNLQGFSRVFNLTKDASFFLWLKGGLTGGGDNFYSNLGLSSSSPFLYWQGAFALELLSTFRIYGSWSDGPGLIYSKIKLGIQLTPTKIAS